MLCLFPEQLISDGFAGLLEHKPFWNHFCALAVDKIHLLYSWSLSFRFVFQQIEFVRCHGCIIGSVVIFASVVGVIWVHHECKSNKFLIYGGITIKAVCEQIFLILTNHSATAAPVPIKAGHNGSDQLSLLRILWTV